MLPEHRNTPSPPWPGTGVWWGDVAASAINVSQGALRIDLIPDSLLETLHIGKAALLFAFPDGFTAVQRAA